MSGITRRRKPRGWRPGRALRSAAGDRSEQRTGGQGILEKALQQAAQATRRRRVLVQPEGSGLRVRAAVSDHGRRRVAVAIAAGIVGATAAEELEQLLQHGGALGRDRGARCADCVMLMAAVLHLRRIDAILLEDAIDSALEAVRTAQEH